MLHRTAFLTLTTLALATVSFVANAADHVFSNTASITINDTAAASVYPSAIPVSGLSGNITHVTVTLHDITHSWIGDLNVLLVAPSGQKIALMGRAGSTTSTGVGVGDNFLDADITFDATAATSITTPSNTNHNYVTGTYLPSVGMNLTPMPAPAPVGPYSSDLSTLNGVAASQQGTWNLYISDQSAGDVGSVAGGWSLTISDAPSSACASAGYKGVQLTWCKNICENGLTGQVLDNWIHRWINRYRYLPACAAGGGEGEGEPQ